MKYFIDKRDEKWFIGLELRTNNEECSTAMPAHKERFFRENILAKIPNKINDSVLALYTEYAGDHTQPYSWVLGCKVAHLNEIPTPVSRVREIWNMIAHEYLLEDMTRLYKEFMTGSPILLAGAERV